jgi:hypothetical protein
MNNFTLEVCSWDEWQFEKDFSNISLAIAHASECYPHDKFRVINRLTGSVVHLHEAITSIETDALNDIERFAEKNKWRERFAQMTEESRMRSIASRQTNEFHIRSVASRQRNQRQEQASRSISLDLTSFLFDDEEDVSSKYHDKVNWTKDGF